ncbi:hypothetical protein JW886_07625 [Lactococcus taiwanensis]|uniref:Uncharacterized protein n=1 Tax=Lactococcus taiwanensis TaxID=1151742 RepID=A0AA45KFD4_9LACT|nr:hypothetical protein [Lactococcus taiwanensis]QSE76328.1 hypothetical protein JW886_07625 [Lactococcus taiwanensis]
MNKKVNESAANDLWHRCIDSNSYTHMGSDVKFDVIADAVIGEKEWNRRDQAMTAIKAMGKILKPEQKLEILKKAGVAKEAIDRCYLKDVSNKEEVVKINNKNKKTTTTIVGEVIAYLLIAAVAIIILGLLARVIRWVWLGY